MPWKRKAELVGIVACFGGMAAATIVGKWAGLIAIVGIVVLGVLRFAPERF